MRYHRQSKRKSVEPWPSSANQPDALVDQVTYIGSAEHKDHASEAGVPRLRSDASRCDPRYSTFEAPTRALREAIRSRQTSSFVGRFPKYAWGNLDGVLYEARLVNQEAGQYKAYPIGTHELPDDPAGLLEAVIAACRS
jgi:hypothetical protein